jgi:phenylalanyl-tRNA synthetase beta chain
MLAPLPWLREYCDPKAGVEEIEERLTMTGTKVESVHHRGVPSTENFVVGKVLSAERHPDADRLKVCSVDLGEGPPATIVCGAPNVAAGQTVAVARPGARLPDGRTLGAAELRGVVSEGMILSAEELELAPGRDGIVVLDEEILDAEFAPGAPLAGVLPIAVEVLELEITPNRPDCLGMYGVARELHAATGAPLVDPPWNEDPGSPGAVAGVQVTVQSPDLCPRFTARAFENVRIAPSPLWLRARLWAAGQRPINNVVDITNYVMLATGQPLHAFDLDRVAGGRLTVRRAADGEQVETLDGQTRTLDSEMVLIEDADGPTSIAGVMGGARSEVQTDTTRVLLEAATWNGPNIHRTSWALGLRSEASSRFEKGLQPEQCLQAQALATRLLVDVAGAQVAAGTIDVGEPPPAARVIRLREARVREILGVPVAPERQREILESLDFAAEPAPDGLDARVPPLRRDDVTREVDLIEEVARINGLEVLPATLPARRGAVGLLTHAQRVRRAAEDVMVGRGLYEIAGWSFADPALLDRLRLPAGHELRRVVTLENPLSDGQSILRPTLLGSLLDAAQHNAARNGPDLAIFESGTVYRAQAAGHEDGFPANEHHALGALLSGRLVPRSWRGEAPVADFFAVKALLEALLGHLHVEWWLQQGHWPFLHPGRGAAVCARRADGSDEAVWLGFVGELHPLVAAGWDLARTAVFAIDVGKLALASPEVVSFKAFPAVPPLRQDIAIVLPAGVPAEEVLARVREAGGETLGDAAVFDVYEGEQLGEGKRSLALALTFRAFDRTLTDEDVAPVRERIVAAVSGLGGELRG